MQDKGAFQMLINLSHLLIGSTALSKIARRRVRSHDLPALTPVHPPPEGRKCFSLIGTSITIALRTALTSATEGIEDSDTG